MMAPPRRCGANFSLIVIVVVVVDVFSILQVESKSNLTFNSEFKIEGVSLGQVSGVALTSEGDLLVFHRGNRAWGQDTFNPDNTLSQKYRTPISQNTILLVKQNTAKIKHLTGANMFYMPHGITVDHEGAVWLTDVGTHQVFKFSSLSASEPALTLGEKFVPGNDDHHFCKPTDVAVDSEGNFFVGDGYCNVRVLKFSQDGKLIAEMKPLGTNFSIPHSLTLDNYSDELYVADRENGIIRVFHAFTCVELRRIESSQFGRVFAVAFSAQGKLLYAVNGGSENPEIKVKGFTISGSDIVDSWNRFSSKFHQPHDIAVSKNGKNVFVAEIGPNRVSKFTVSRP